MAANPSHVCLETSMVSSFARVGDPFIYVEFTTFSASFRVLSSYELCVTLPKRTELCQIRQFRMKERGLYHRVSDRLRRVLFSGSKAIIS